MLCHVCGVTDGLVLALRACLHQRMEDVPVKAACRCNCTLIALYLTKLCLKVSTMAQEKLRWGSFVVLTLVSPLCCLDRSCVCWGFSCSTKAAGMQTCS
jgi:hypothetical protein